MNAGGDQNGPALKFEDVEKQYPDGTVAIPNNGLEMSDVTIGNAFREGEEVLDRIAGFDPSNHSSNYDSTYGPELIQIHHKRD